MTLETKALFHLTGDVAPPQITPDGPYGERRFMPVTGGTITGARINGVLLAGGSDCQLIRPDGVAELDVRVVIKTDDGVHILMKGLGMRHGAPDVIKRLQAGEEVGADEYYFRESFMFEAPPGPYDWLNKIIGIGIGARNAKGVSIECFEVL
jgi:hypothetical protein